MLIKDWLDNAKMDANWKPEISADWLEKQLIKLKEVPLISNPAGLYSAKLAIKQMKQDNIELVNLVGFLYYINRSALIPSQTKNPRLGALTPLVMYAHKFYNDIPYSAWAREVELAYFLGRGLESLLEVKEPIIISDDEKIKLRVTALTTKTTQEMQAANSYKFNVITINDTKYSGKNNIGRMLLQTWLANGTLRDIESMILDPFDWDLVPDALDEKVSGVGSVKNWWDKEGVETI